VKNHRTLLELRAMPDDGVALDRARETRERADIELAVAALHPERFGLRRRRDGWRKPFPDLGQVVFAPLGWQHAQCPSFDLIDGERVPLDALSFVVRLQARVWGMPPEELVPVNMLAVLPDTGGSVIVAYREEAGFNTEGWLGFVIAAGSCTGTLVSHMLGVREDQRGTRDLGWHLKLLQGYEALRSGHRSAIWTFDPMRGANARLNLEKLGATVRELTLDKYGVLRSDLYGDVPSDRFTTYWDLLSATTHGRIDDVRTGRYPGPDPEYVRSLPEISVENAASLAKTAPPAARYRIPADVDDLMNADARRANAWRSEMRAALSPFVTVKSARVPASASDSPIAMGIDLRPGAYDVVAFATELRTPGDRENWYVLRRRGGVG
jgi:predicted GNAT superfamily acetyltransferase